MIARGCNQSSELPAPPRSAKPHTHTIAAHMGQGAPKDKLVTFVIGAHDGQCHKNPIVTIIVGNKRFKKVVHCSEIGGHENMGVISKGFHTSLMGSNS